MKYIIVYDDTYNLHYYCRFVFNSEEHWWMLTSRNLKDVRPYDTRKDAQDEIDRYDPDLSELSNTKQRFIYSEIERIMRIKRK